MRTPKSASNSLALVAVAAAATLAACGGSQASFAPPAAQPAARHSRTFEFTGQPQAFVVPSGVT